MRARVLISVLSLIGATLVGEAGAMAAAPSAQALPDGLALTPPMGFNNWNATGCAIDETLIRATADFFVTSGLREAGYEYVNIDDCWAEQQRDPATGRYVAHHERFPSGIKALADYVHERGLKLGIYTSAGTLTCARTMPGSLDHEEIDAQTFADWGVDYLKYDNCNNEGRPALERYPRMRDALKKTGRPIVFSICEWGQNRPWEWGADVGHLWRTTGDISDSWTSMVSLLEQNAPLAQYAGPGHWNDPDMLEVGNGGMTTREYRSHFSLWAAMAAPLLIGSDLRKATPETMAILLNREVIAVDQDPLGVQGRVLRKDGGHWVIVKPLQDGDVAVTLFNQSEATATFGATAAELGLPTRPAYGVRDLWEHRTYESAGRISRVGAGARHGDVPGRRGRSWLVAAPAGNGVRAGHPVAARWCPRHGHAGRPDVHRERHGGQPWPPARAERPGPAGAGTRLAGRTARPDRETVAAHRRVADGRVPGHATGDSAAWHRPAGRIAVLRFAAASADHPVRRGGPDRADPGARRHFRPR